MTRISQTKTAFSCLILLILITATGCTTPTPMVVVVTQNVPQTVIVTQLVTVEVTPVPSLTPIPEITPTSTSSVGDFEYYYPFTNSDCGLSIVHLGDRVYVSYGGSTNALRSTSDNRFPTNIIGYALQGEILDVVDGPICSYGMTMWKVKTSYNVSGWTPEGNGSEYWLIPMK